MKSETIKQIANILGTADSFGHLDLVLGNLPGASLSNVKNCAGFERLQKAKKLADEAEKLRKEALAEFAESLLAPGDGWTATEIRVAYEKV